MFNLYDNQLTKMQELTDRRETFAISDHGATSYSAAEILGTTNHEKVTYTGKNGWFVARWQAIVIGVIIFTMLFIATYVGRFTGVDKAEEEQLPYTLQARNHTRPLDPPLPSVQEAILSAHTNITVDDLAADMRYLIEPIDYIIYLKPFVEIVDENYEKFTFSGNVSITLRVREELKYVVIGAHDLRIISINLNKITSVTDDGLHEVEKNIGLSIDSYDVYEGTLNLEINEWLQPFQIYELLIEFNGDVQNLPYGLFRSFYKDTDTGETRWIVGTNLDIPFARTVFPCFDSPTQTATFQLNIAREENMRVDSSAPFWQYYQPNGDKWVWQRFLRTKKIPVHMLAFVVSSFYNEFKVAPHIPYYTIWTAKKRTQELAYVMEIGPNIIRDLELYLGTTMPVKKINIFGLPQIIPRQKAKMGMIYLSEADLIVKEDSTSEEHKQTVAQLLVGHLVEQWIENSVIFQWGYDDWIKEAIVQYFEYVLLRFIEPSWKTLDHFFVKVQQIEMEKEIPDPTRKPLVVRWIPFVEQSKMHYLYPINETLAFRRSEKTEKIASHPHFETLANPNIYTQLYEKKLTDKGACLIRMIKHIITEPLFVASLRIFIENSRGKVVNGDDLWDIMTAEAMNTVYPGYQLLPEGVSLQVVLEDWIYTEGYPLVTVTRNYDKNTITFSQNVNLDNMKGFSMRLTLWYIPISYTTENEKFFTSTAPRFWLSKVKKVDIVTPTALSDNSWFLANPQQTGFYRVQYDMNNWILLQNALKDGQFPETIRAQLIDDALFLGRKGQLDYEFALNFINLLSGYRETEYTIWNTVLRHLNYARNILQSTESYNRYNGAVSMFKIYVRWLISPVFVSLNSKWTETHNLDHNDRLLRSDIFLWACAMDMSECNTIARAEFDRWKSSSAPDLENPIEPDMRYAILCSIMQIGGTSDYDFLMKRYLNTQSTNPEKYTYLKSLYCFKSEEHYKRLINTTLEDDYSVDHLHMISMMWSAIPESFYVSQVPYNFMIDNWVALISRFSEFKTILQTIVEAATNELQDLSQLEILNNLKETNKADIPYIEHSFEVAIRNLIDRKDWQTNQIGTLVDWLEKNSHKENHRYQYAAEEKAKH